MRNKANIGMMKVLEYGMFFLIGFLAAFLVFTGPSFQGQVVKETEFVEKEKVIVRASANIVAVSSVDNSGVLGKVNVELTEGDGKILVNTNPFLEPDIQESANIAAEVAQRIAIEKLKDRNLIYTFDVGEANVLGGHSAGAAMTMATMAALLGKGLKDEIVITGTIREDGVIGHVGGLIEKAQAVSENNKKVFLIPKGQSTLTYYEKEIKETQKGRFTISRTYYIPKKFDLKAYGKDELGIEVREVETIYDVIDIMLK